MDPAALILEVFGVGSLGLAFAKYTYAKRKEMNAKDNMKNTGVDKPLYINHI